MTREYMPQIVTGEDWQLRIARFRVEVWLLNDMIDPSYFPEGHCLEAVDTTATHIIVETYGRLVGATRYAQYDDINSTHLGLYYQEAGIELQGSVVVPEHTVVHPDLRGQGLHRMLADALVERCIQQDARYMISECSPAAADLLKKRGRKSLGMAPHDPRFPNTQFEWMLADIEQIETELASHPVSKKD